MLFESITYKIIYLLVFNKYMSISHSTFMFFRETPRNETAPSQSKFTFEIEQ